VGIATTDQSEIATMTGRRRLGRLRNGLRLLAQLDERPKVAVDVG
jgi:hypothetical protein